jgi:outer membrane protein TolC
MLTGTRPPLVLVTLLVIGSCGGCAHYAPKPLAPERSLAQLEQRRLTDPAVLNVVRERTGGSESWGRAQLLVAALELNPAVREARATLAQTQAGLRTARALQNPTISLASEYDLTRAAESPWLWGLASSVLLDSFASRGLRTDLAQANLRGARADFEEALWTVRRDLRTALLATVISARRVTALEQEQRGRAEFLRLARTRVAAGESARSEVLQADLELARSTAALEDARSVLVDSRAKLAAALGVSANALADVEPQFEDLDAPVPVLADSLGPLRERALLSRGDLARAIADYDARELDLRQQMSAQYLQASLGPGYTYDHGVRKLTLGASIALPIFNRNEGPIAEAMAAREAAGQHVLTVQAGILNNIDGARAAYAAALDALQRARAQRITSEAIAQSTQRALDVDAADRPTLLAAELSASTERLAELDALDRAQQALGQLEDALRRPLAGPEKDLRFLEGQP